MDQDEQAPVSGEVFNQTAASEDTAVAEQPRRFVVKLMQTVEACTEQFTYGPEDSVSNKKEALRKAQNFLDDEKEVEGEYRLVVEEIVPEDPAVAETPPTEPTE